MNEISSADSVFAELAISRKQNDKDASQELGQSAFLELMITQMENQSPLDPQDNTQFIAQLAQFSSVESLDKLNKNFDSFSDNFIANQALQASSLVGRSVTVPAEQTALEAGGIVNLSSELPASTSDLSLNIYNESGSLVEQIDLGAQRQGSVLLRWDGMNAELNGQLLDWKSSHDEGLPPANYRFELSARIDGEERALDTALSANVNSVTVAADGTLALNLAGIGTVSLADVKQFNE
ncbi:flagellar hook assembly protein FlgD [Agaribacterium haliotis]|uniref:flagellar hook assembly protein FlgD n=1 Tax=Agaribacterium haliotis TaxID=2013869 RepID=UPI000BB55DF8|nr:flagellar hook assembly protein FlgD [Agaribacterium haliotis]